MADFYTNLVGFVLKRRRMPRVDIHQHLWPEALVAGLARRRTAPRLYRSGSAWALELAGEPAAEIDLAAQSDPAARLATLERDEIDVAVIAPSTPLGIEALPAEEAEPLLAAHHEGIGELGGPFRFWATLPDGAGPAALDAVLDAGAVGLCLAGRRLAGPAALAAHAPLLTRLAARGRPLLVHPGPAPATRSGAPAWWPAMTSYVAEMHAAWLAFATWGRPVHPRLEVVWAMLAGGAPLHGERLASRGGPVHALSDPRASYEISSYGHKAIDA